MISEWINLETIEDLIIDFSLHFLMTVQLHYFTLRLSIKQEWKVDYSEVGVYIALVRVILLHFLSKPFFIVVLNVNLIVDFIIVELCEVYLITGVSLSICFVEYVHDADDLLNMFIIEPELCLKPDGDLIMQFPQYRNEGIFAQLDQVPLEKQLGLLII